jgi:hypothetical protein
MTGVELLKIRMLLGITQASAAYMCGATSTGIGTFAASDIITAENLGGAAIADSGLNVACEKFLRPALKYAGGL